MMNIPESLLHYIWQFQYFDKRELVTTNGENLAIIFRGMHNHNQGPDFSNAKIKIGTIELAGNIEIHVKASDWLRHGHTGDEHYANVILHVVWEEDTDLGLPFPTLKLHGRVSYFLLENYRQLMEAQEFIPCAKQVKDVPEIVVNLWKDRLLAERMESRYSSYITNLNRTAPDWEALLWEFICRSFGTPVNTDAFDALAKTLPMGIIAKHSNQIHQLEALLFGTSGMLQAEFSDPYPLLLQREYNFLQKKYRLNIITHTMNFLRMRPANFPTIRLAQLAMFLLRSKNVFSAVMEAKTIDDVLQILNVAPNDYWLYHYTLQDEAVWREKNLGSQMSQTIIINGIIPFLFFYAKTRKDEAALHKAEAWMQSLAPEKNTITSAFTKLGIPNENAAASQSLLQLKKHYCNQKRCLECSIGNAILKSAL